MGEKEQIVIRKLTVKDVPAIAEIINSYASEGLLLPKSHHQLYECIRDFVAATSNGRIVGCGALHVVWDDLGEVRSLAVVQDRLRRGIGQLMVKHLLGEAVGLGLPRAFTLTYEQRFFERLGFHVVPRDSLPHKVWADCLDCPKFPNCDEIAMIKELSPAERE